MVTSYLLSSTLVPVLSVWLLENRHGTHGHGDGEAARPGFFVRLQDRFERVVSWTVAHRLMVVLAYLVAAGAVVVGVGRAARPRAVPEGRRRPVPAPRPPAAGDPLRADPPGRAEDARRDRRGGRAGERRHHDGLRRGEPAAVHHQHGLPLEPRARRQHAPRRPPRGERGRRLRAPGAAAQGPAREGGRVVPRASSCGWASPPSRPTSGVADLVFAFEPGDLISETMSLGAPAPIEVVVSGRNLADSSAFMDKLRKRVRRDRVAPRRPGPAVAPLPDRAGDPRPRAGRAQRRDRPRHRRVADRGHLLQPLHRRGTTGATTSAATRTRSRCRSRRRR